MARPTKEEVKAAADRAEARSAGILDDDEAEWERGFNETVEAGRRELDLEIIEAELGRLALLPDLTYQLERVAAAERLRLSRSVLDKHVKARRPKEAAKESAPVFDPDKLQDSASHIIKDQNILDLFAEDFSKVIAGEEVNGKLLYLVATSRLFDKPMNAAIKGTSAGGKSEIRKRVLEFLLPEDVVTFASLSEKALIYYDGDFPHKILSMGEATATEEKQFQDYLLRELMSEGHIRHSVPQKIGNDIWTVTIEKHGPVAFLVTTTQNLLHAENETRMLSLEIDDSQDQTKKVLKKIAQVVGLQNAPPVDYNPWQDFQRWLGIGERRVVVPFADALADLMEALAVRLRRDFGQVLAAIQAHALLHRGQRDRDESGRIVADIDHDYAAIRELMSAIVAEGTGADIKKEMAETIKAVAEATVGMEKTEGATAKEVGKILKLDRSAAWRRLAATCDEGFCINLETRKGMAGKYRTTGQQIEPIVVLPSVEDLAKKHAHSSLCPPSKTAEPCNRDEIDQSTQVDDGCKLCNRHATKQLEEPGRLHGCKPVANGLATDNSLNSKVKSPPVARFADFPGGIEREEEGARAFRSDVEDAKEELREREAETPICAHCGRPGGEAFAFGEFFAEALHPRCRHDWLVAQGADMDL